MQGFGLESMVLSSHVKVKVCDPNAASNCRSLHAVPRLCSFLISALHDESTRLTCRFSGARRVSHESSFGPS